MEEWIEYREDNDEGNFWFNFDLDFPIEKYRFDPCKERIRSLFDQLLVAFMKEKSTSNCIRPIPVLCRDGRLVDLFKLFCVVRKIGGHDEVSRNNLWGFVSEECGFGIGVLQNIKLIHMKYLNELDQWLKQVVRNRILEHGNDGLDRKLDLLYGELENMCMNLLSGEHERERSNFSKMSSEDELHLFPSGGISEKIQSENGRSNKHVICELNEACVDIEKNISDFAVSRKRVVKKCLEKVMNGANGFFNGRVDYDSGKSCYEDNGNITASAKKVVEKVINKVGDCEGTISIDDDKLFVQDKNDVCISAKKVVKKFISFTHDLSQNIIDDEERVGDIQGIDNVIPVKSYSRKRKRQSQSFWEMLKWLTHVAKLPDDLSVAEIPECSKWRDHGYDELWVQAMLAREALLIRRQAKANTNADEDLLKDKQKKPKMHPSLYQDDALDHESTETLRCSKRVPTSSKSQFYPCCNSNVSQSNTTLHQEPNNGNSPKAPMELVHTDIDELPINSNNPISYDMSVERQVSVGPLFQAQVPEWTGVISESDPKWLGTRMWPPKDGERKAIPIKLEPLGEGRLYSCDCQFPNSVECVRFHVAEKRLKLKRELGSLFYRWRFNRMGEEVSLSWTEDEEKKFKDMMRSYASFPNKFWNNATRFLPSKTRERLVSYYFNVFIVHRRSYQNRVTPRDVDSDNDEKECGSVGGYFGYKALYVPGSSFVSCTLNKESYELV